MRFIAVVACVLVLAASVFLFGCQGISGGFEQKSNLTLASPAFAAGGEIPRAHTCDASDVSPPLTISKIPEGTQSLALVVEDPDAPMKNWVHWIVWNIPAGTTDIAKNTVPEGAVQGPNNYGAKKWDGPCPPQGQKHNYVFKLYALDTVLNIPDSSGKPRLEAEMQGHVLGQTSLTAKYTRPI